MEQWRLDPAQLALEGESHRVIDQVVLPVDTVPEQYVVHLESRLEILYREQHQWAQLNDESILSILLVEV